METSVKNIRCPRCNRRLRETREKDYGWCINHGEIYIGDPLELSEDYKRLLGPFVKGYGKL